MVPISICTGGLAKRFKFLSLSGNKACITLRGRISSLKTPWHLRELLGTALSQRKCCGFCSTKRRQRQLTRFALRNQNWFTQTPFYRHIHKPFLCDTSDVRKGHLRSLYCQNLIIDIVEGCCNIKFHKRWLSLLQTVLHINVFRCSAGFY